ncbi:MAG: hypothetical protein IPP88_19695 [Betaproteobacteria bacterium]|nr:hypothetical protein [Betaproteobacteria bacterium]
MNNKLSRFIPPGIAAVALAFGMATIVSGGHVLFGDQAARDAAGSYMPFVVWFNFLAGFAYIVAGVGLARGSPWVARLSLDIAATTALVFFVFALFVLTGDPFEMRTAGAMTLRITLWAGIAWFAWRQVVKP